MNNLDDMTRQEKALVMVIGVAESLEELGIVTKSRCYLTDEDRQRFHEMTALGFMPSNEEWAWAIAAVAALCKEWKASENGREENKS